MAGMGGLDGVPNALMTGGINRWRVNNWQTVCDMLESALVAADHLLNLNP